MYIPINLGCCTRPSAVGAYLTNNKQGKPSDVCLILLLIDSASVWSPPHTSLPKDIGGVWPNGVWAPSKEPFTILPMTTLLTWEESITSAFNVNSFSGSQESFGTNSCFLPVASISPQ